jgi:hypothetical protein
VRCAARIEPMLAMRTRGRALKIFANGQLRSAVAAHYCLFASFLFRPNLSCMSSQLGMTLKAREPVVATSEPNRDDIAFAMIMGASRLPIDIYAPDGYAVNFQFRLLNFLSRTQQDQC